MFFYANRFESPERLDVIQVLFRKGKATSVLENRSVIEEGEDGSVPFAIVVLPEAALRMIGGDKRRRKKRPFRASGFSLCGSAEA